MSVHPYNYVQNKFIHFLCHDSTQIRKYDQGLLPWRAINRKNKWRKCFPLIVAVLTILIIIHLIPISQDLIHWLKPVGIRVIVAKSEVSLFIIKSLSMLFKIGCLFQAAMIKIRVLAGSF